MAASIKWHRAGAVRNSGGASAHRCSGRRSKMKSAILLLFALASLRAQGLQVLLHTPGNSDDGTAVGSTFSFPDTSVGASATVTFRLKNTSATQVFLVRTIYSAS